jgi:pilus assembly protein CpaC
MFSGAKSSATPQGVGIMCDRISRKRWLWSVLLIAGLGGTAVVAAPPSPPQMLPTPQTPSMPDSWQRTGLTTKMQPSGGVPTIAPSAMNPIMPPVILGPDGIKQASFQDPGVQGPGTLPQPKPLPFGDDKVRLPRLAGAGQLGATPVPTEKELEEYRKFIEGVIDPRNTLDLIEGRARIVLLKTTPVRTQIADETVASFRILEPQGRQMTIIGQKPGITVLNLWFTDPDDKDKEKILSYLVRVLPDPETKERMEAIYKALEIEINKAFPNSRVRLTLVGDKLMVSGQAHDIYEATQIMRIVRANAPGQGNGAANRSPFAPISSIGPTAQPFDPLRPDATPGIESYETIGGPNVINNLRVPGEQQVMLRVVVAEVNRAAARSIGLNFSVINNQGTTVFSQQTGNLISGLNQGGAGGLANLPVNLDNGQFPLAINALRVLNYAKSLAEPNLTAMNGQTALFLAGGQFPVPVVTGFGQFGGGLQGVQFVPFGVQLFFTPIITDRDRIRLTMIATVSTRDNAAGANVAGTNVPGLNTRTFSTTVELREGQTMAVAGLIQTNHGATAERVPFFGDLPLFGRLASFQRVSAGEQELVVLVTPELVHPLEPQELPLLPGSDIFEPGDLEFYLLGRLESRRMYDYRSPVMTDIHRMLSYRRCEQNFIIGPSGHVDPPNPGTVVPAGAK